MNTGADDNDTEEPGIPKPVARLYGFFRAIRHHWFVRPWVGIVVAISTIGGAIACFKLFCTTTPPLILEPAGPSSVMSASGRTQKAPAIVNADNWPEGMVEKEAGRVGHDIGSWSDHPEWKYSLVLHVHAKFQDAQYNSRAYLDSISNLGASRTDMIAQSPADPVHFVATHQPPSSDHELNWVVLAVFSAKPAKSDVLRFSTGPVVWEASIGSLKWIRRSGTGESGGEWYLAQGSLDIRIGDPDWPIFDSARFLPTANGNTWILEISIANGSALPIAIHTVNLRATHGEDVECAFKGEYHEKVQSVTLHWDRLVETGGSKGGATTIADSRIDVPSKFTFAGPCNNWKFSANIPVQVDVEAKQQSRITVRMTEYPSKSPLQGGIAAFTNSVPRRLRDWQQLYVAPTGSREIYPRARAAVELGK